MALQKSYEKISGATGDYWRIESVQFGRPNMRTKTVDLHVVFTLYKSKTAFQAGKPSMGKNKSMDITLSLSQVATFVYNHAKLNITNDQAGGDTPYFEDAVDV